MVGHSWGTLVALAFAVRFRADTAGLVLLSGYYFPNLRLDALLVAVGAIPIWGDVLRYTISPDFRLDDDAADQAPDVRPFAHDRTIQGRIFHGHGAAAIPDPGDCR